MESAEREIHLADSLIGKETVDRVW